MKCCWLANLFRCAAGCHPGLRNWFTEFAHKDFSFIKNMLKKQEMIMKINETSWKRTISLFRLRKYCTKNLVSLGLLCLGVNLATSCSTEVSSETHQVVSQNLLINKMWLFKNCILKNLFYIICSGIKSPCLGFCCFMFLQGLLTTN